MTKLSKAQQAMLTDAANTGGGAIEASEDRKATSASLIKHGLMISIPQADGPSRLLITDAGRAAIGEATQPSAPPEPPLSSAEAPADQPTTVRAPKGKVAALVELLRRPDGATIQDMMGVTGWQAHSVRGAMSGAIKKGLGLTVSSTKTEAGRVYQIAAEAEA